MKALSPGLVILVKEVILYLAEGPLIGIDNLFEEGHFIMEGESRIAYPPIRQCIVQKFSYPNGM
jgi:hypothetical protein